MGNELVNFIGNSTAHQPQAKRRRQKRKRPGNAEQQPRPADALSGQERRAKREKGEGAAAGAVVKEEPGSEKATYGYPVGKIKANEYL